MGHRVLVLHSAIGIATSAERKGAILSFAWRGDCTDVSAHDLASGQTTRLVNAQMSELGDVIGAADDPERTVVGIGVCDRYDAQARVRSVAFPQGLARPPADLDVQVVHCYRTDGAPLSPRVWTQRGSKGRKPLLLWIYPSIGLPKSPVHSALDLRGATPVALTYAGFAVACVEIPILGDRPGANDTLISQTVDSLTCLAARLAALPGIASDRMAIGGFSYGAALTTIALAHTSRFRAGLVRSGCYNRTQTPFGFQDERRWLWEIPHLYIQLSPLLYAHKIHAPVLFIHGLQDSHRATPAAQSVALFRALRRLGKNARCVLLPDEGHEQQSLPAAERILAEMTAWLEVHMEF